MKIEFKMRELGGVCYEDAPIVATSELPSFGDAGQVCKVLLDIFPNVWEVRMNEQGSGQGHYFSDWERYEQLKEDAK